MNIAHLRKEYTLNELDTAIVKKNPLEQFNTWFDEACQAKADEPNAMVLGTVNQEGRPSSRVVLLKEVSGGGFVFYTNYFSHKGRELLGNPFASLLFFWPVLERQVRIEGKTDKLDELTSTDYFHSRPRGSQLGAWASAQSEMITGRHILEESMQKLEQQYPDGTPIPKPPHWGGYRLIPDKMEFWQGRQSRLHDRIVYIKEETDWRTERLSP